MQLWGQQVISMGEKHVLRMTDLELCWKMTKLYQTCLQ